MKKAKKLFWNLVLVISTVVFLYSAYNVYYDYRASYVAKNQVESLEEEVFLIKKSDVLEAEELDAEGNVKESNSSNKILDYDKLYSINSDAVGWIEIPNTPLSEPLVIAKNNEKYLWHNFYGKRYPLTGAIFIDYKNDKNLTEPLTYIFGHHMYDDSKFTVLKKFLNQDFLNANKSLFIYDRNTKHEYEIVKAVDLPEATELYNMELNKDFKLRKKLFKEKLGIDIEENDKYLMLITCKSPKNSDVRTCMFCKLK